MFNFQFAAVRKAACQAVADAAKGDGVAAAVEGADVVLPRPFARRADFEQQDRLAAETVAREAAIAGVRQIVYLGGLGTDDPDASAHLRSRRETGVWLSFAGVPVTTLRAAMIVGRGSAAFETILGLVKRLPVMVTPSRGLDTDAADRARRHRLLSRRRLRQRAHLR